MNEIQFLIYEDSDKVEVLIREETIWATQKTISQLFDVGVPAISKHLKNIFESGELEEDRTVSKMEIVRNEGSREVKRETTFYNLDVIISIGYRVNSQKATKFRIWATDILKDYIQKGFKIDVERMKQGENAFGKDYFRELLETVRSIRASERRIWQQITDVFAEISYDYDKNSEITKQFYATVQNKFHYAITGKTAAEIVFNGADKTKENMGLTTWKNSPDGRILQSDVSVAKNYLSEKQIRSLERNVSSYFDYVERLLEDETLLGMEDFAKSIDEFLTFNRYQILDGNGKISSKAAKRKAVDEYKEFNKHQHIVSDFDKEITKIEGELK
ncbi:MULTISPECIES: virulence RhuM family protein [Enterococcus]|uniref:virulence RhuM family protein n=1 Tax=Enterococcus TaxID=1350 RepID=UPI00265B7CFB|nr:MULTISPECIES: virulence RhuM family protein [unclassified Enterococcus]EMF0383445.1 virulence RhuM family protein [Enterococcus hirae]MDU3374394.1 virulence RhuM family protein [Enterococcus casseliflavus]HAQ6870336.1 virulence RhuM family protein [Enterococcus faecium]MDO0895016.1 virulence RhuM family protein [Enterococcus sp. B1E4]MDO0907969.1 virulence RhuM family protein [Enterococcus sp. B2E4]